MSEHIHEKVVTSAIIPARSLTLTSSNNIVVNHWHNSLELIYISEGHMDVGVNDKMYSLHAGDLLIVNSANLHYTQVYDLTTVNYTLQIPYSLLKTHIPDYDFLHFQGPNQDGLLNGGPHYETLCSHIVALQELIHEQEYGYSVKYNSLLFDIIHILLCNYSSVRNSAEKRRDEWHHERNAQIINYVNAHYAQPITLEDGANLLSLNTEYFCRYFKKNFGKTFIEYVNSVRLSHIHDDLLNTNLPVSTLLERHGFANYRTFIKMFRAAYGCTPAELRRQK